ncbi:MAG: ATP-binding protein [Pseudomonadota bacterium]|nr:ATP-binding protein [Pseudomonadota bacterium]
MMAVRRNRKYSIWLYYSASVAIILVALLLVTLYVADRFRGFFSDHLETVLEARARGIGLDIQAEQPLPDDLEAYCLVLKPTDPDIRVTVVDFAGTVLCDSEGDPAQMENHRLRPEILAAFNGHTGSVIRFSNTVRAQLLYVAVLQNRSDSKPWVVRAALPLSSIDQLLGEVFHTLLGVLLVLVAAIFVVSIYLYRKINPPLVEIRHGAERFAHGRFEIQLPEYQVREIDELAGDLNRMATQLDRLENLRQDFVANVSHELKTPVTTIAGFVETLLEGAKDDSDELNHFLEIISRQADRLAAIIDDLLTLSRLESAPLHEILELREQSLPDILDSSNRICRERADEKHISLKVECPATLHVRADRSLLTQAVINLVDNAIKYSSANTSVVMRGGETGDGVQIEVEDNGPGIDERHKARLFERFYRVDKARSRKLGGTGLGLAIVKHIVSVHGGEVQVETRIGKGSTFIILLPHYLGSR